jgi:hypothetical protein
MTMCFCEKHGRQPCEKVSKIYIMNLEMVTIYQKNKRFILCY